MTPAADRNIASGAEMLLALTRNRALHNSFLRKPAKFMPKVEYELRKHLEIRLRDMSGADVAALESRVIPRVAQTVGSLPTISSDDDFPEGTKAKGADLTMTCFLRRSATCGSQTARATGK